MQIAIIGGGIGGTALALSLHAAGIEDLAIFESVPAIRELSVGINLRPNAVRELAELGLLDALLAVGIPTAEFFYFTKGSSKQRVVTAAVVQANRRAGPARCQDLVEERAPDGFTHLHEVVSHAELAAIGVDYKRTAGFDIERLNERPSLSVR